MQTDCEGVELLKHLSPPEVIVNERLTSNQTRHLCLCFGEHSQPKVDVNNLSSVGLPSSALAHLYILLQPPAASFHIRNLNFPPFQTFRFCRFSLFVNFTHNRFAFLSHRWRCWSRQWEAVRHTVEHWAQPAVCIVLHLAPEGTRLTAWEIFGSTVDFLWPHMLWVEQII